MLMWRCARTSFQKMWTAICLSGVLLLGSGSVWAGDLPRPQGKPLLSVSGKIAHTNVAGTAQFDRDQLMALGLHTLKTQNPYISGEHVFEGVLLADVLKAAGVQGQMMTAYALDGYNVDIPVGDAFRFDVLLAMKMDGKVMRVRSKGPLWIIYPVSDHEELSAEFYSGRSIWQVKAIEVK